jgi:plasmid stabilization system protein ParE
MTARLRVLGPAQRQAKQAAAWWRTNRPSARELFRRELASAFDLLQSSPEMGTRYDDADVPDLRRVLLPETRYHVYYVYQADLNQILILGIWSSQRGHAPPWSGRPR